MKTLQDLYKAKRSLELKWEQHHLNSGKYTLDMVNIDHKVRAVIADIKMKGNLNLELVKELPGIVDGMPVILVTGYPSLSSAVQSIQFPVVGCLIKPFEFTELLADVHSAIADKGIRLRGKHLRGVINTIANHLEEVGDVPSQTELLENFSSITGTKTFLKGGI